MVMKITLCCSIMNTLQEEVVKVPKQQKKH